MLAAQMHCAAPHWVLVISAVATLCLCGGVLHGQERSFEKQGEIEIPRQASGNTAIPINTPGDTEVMRSDKGAIEPLNAPTYPTEGPVDPQKYVCGRGDVFELNFWGRQNFKLRITVDLEGRTFIPKIGYVEIVGRTLAQARAIIRRAVARYYPGLNFDLGLVVPRTFVVHVAGYVTKPGAYVTNAIERVASILARASGISGSKRRIEIERHDGSRLNADLVLYEFTGDTKYNPQLLDGDVVLVPRADVSASISGAVNRPGHYELTGSKDMAELIDLGGGFKSSATRSLPIRLVRRNSKEHYDTTLILMPSTGDHAPTVPLRDDDQVTIPSTAELQRSVAVIGPVPGATPADEVTAIRRFEFVGGSTVRTILEGAGTIGSSADLKRAYVRKSGGRLVQVDLEALLMRRDFSVDRPVEVGDTIVIPQRRYAVAVEGAVMRPALYPFNPLFSGEQYVATAGGPKQNARGAGAYKLIGSDGQTKPLRKASSINPGDTILVPERAFSRAEVVQLVVGGVGLLVSAFSLVYLVTR